MSVQILDSIPDIPSQQPSNTTRYFNNGLRVSDVSYPMYFPQAATKLVGEDRIIGIGRFTMPLSQDNFGYFSLVVFCSDGIYVMGVDRTGATAYLDSTYAHPEVCTNRNSICEIGGGIFFSTDKGLCLLTKDNVTLTVSQLDGKSRFLPDSDPTYAKEGHGIYHELLTTSDIVDTYDFWNRGDFEDSLSIDSRTAGLVSNFVDFINQEYTYVRYISKKNKLVVFNRNYAYSYFIDIQTGCTTKLGVNIWFGDGNYPEESFWAGRIPVGNGAYAYYKLSFGFYSANEQNLPCLICSRPIQVTQDDKSSYRFVLSGFFEAGSESAWAYLLVFGSLDGDNWHLIGKKGKKLGSGAIGNGFHNIGCVTDRVSWKYLMFVFAGKLSYTSHIDSIDMTVTGRYNNKKR